MTLVVVRAAGLITIQDRGRPGRMHEALPPGGALVDELLVAANRAARNLDGAAAIEVLGQLVVRAETDVEVAADAEPRVLHAGDELTIASGARRVAYLAVRGGVDAPIVLGGRGTMLSAGLGAPIRAGQRIAPGGEPIAHATSSPRLDDDAPIRVIPGPDRFPPEALAALMSAPYRISPESNRVGTRLVGPTIPRLADADASRPMVRGAIEVPRDGAPIVLGPEHPTTGGYPVVGVVASADIGRLFAVRPGGVVRFQRS